MLQPTRILKVSSKVLNFEEEKNKIANEKLWRWSEKSCLFTEARLEFCLWFRDTAVAQEQSWDKFTTPLGNPEHSMMGNPEHNIRGNPEHDEMRNP